MYSMAALAMLSLMLQVINKVSNQQINSFFIYFPEGLSWIRKYYCPCANSNSRHRENIRSDYGCTVNLKHSWEQCTSTGTLNA